MVLLFQIIQEIAVSGAHRTLKNGSLSRDVMSVDFVTSFPDKVVDYNIYLLGGMEPSEPLKLVVFKFYYLEELMLGILAFNQCNSSSND